MCNRDAKMDSQACSATSTLTGENARSKRQRVDLPQRFHSLALRASLFSCSRCRQSRYHPTNPSESTQRGVSAHDVRQCDFYAKKVLTIKGFRDLFLLVFIHVETRRVFIAPSTFHPNEAWVKEQAITFLKHVEDTGLGAPMVMHDRDTKFTASFDDLLKSRNVEVKQVAHRSPNTKGHGCNQ
jgi:hypothetical protein